MKYVSRLGTMIILLGVFVLFQNCSENLPDKSTIASSNSPTQSPLPVPSPSPFKAIFPASSIWSRDISQAVLDSESSTIIAALVSSGGWSASAPEINSSSRVVNLTSAAPIFSLVQAPGYYLPACDTPTGIPVPSFGGLQGGADYSSCSGGCRLLVNDQVNSRLYESYGTSIASNQVTSGCTVVWDTSKAYPSDGRGDQCTSAGPSGMPVAPFLFTADELGAGRIDHALSFALPGAKIRSGLYVRPATHAVGGNTGGADTPAFGALFRLKANFPISQYSPGLQTILTALKKHGMYLTEGYSGMSIFAASDQDTVRKFSEFGITSSSLDFLNPSDFEVIDGGARIPLTYNCIRNGQ